MSVMGRELAVSRVGLAKA